MAFCACPLALDVSLQLVGPVHPKLPHPLEGSAPRAGAGERVGRRLQARPGNQGTLETRCLYLGAINIVKFYRINREVPTKHTKL